MMRLRDTLGVSCVLLAAYGCTPQGSSSFLSTPGANQSSGSNANSVGDVTTGHVTEGGTEFPVPSLAVRARVRNESSSGSDMTVKFLRGNSIVNISFIRAVPASITTVTSPESAQLVELTGVDANGHVLPSKIFTLGVDFQTGIPAEYIIRDPSNPTPPDNGGGDGSTSGGSTGGASGGSSGGTGSGSSGQPDGWTDNGGGSPPPGPGPVTPALTIVEPADSVAIFIGQTVHVRWDDTATDTTSTVSLFLKLFGDANKNHWISLGPAVGALLDGTNDQLDVLIEGVDAGSYEIVGVLTDPASSDVIAVAPGKIDVQKPSEGIAPTITLTPQTSQQVIYNGDAISIQWSDVDPGGNATITFSLESSDPSETGVQVFTLSPTFPGDPDGAGDSAAISIHGVIPGTYDLVARISDNGLAGSDRLSRAVSMLPDLKNDPPTFSFVEPALDIDVAAGQRFEARWTDSDANDNAQISFLLDPDWQNIPLDGNEYLLASSISEDPDGVGDQTRLVLPAGLPNGAYVLVAVINDGLIEVQVRAAAFIYVGRNSDDQNGQGGGDGQIGGDVGAGPVGTLTSIEPFADVVDDVTQTLMVHSMINGPVPSRQQIFISNVAYGGSTKIEVTPAATGTPAKTSVYSLDLSSIPNDAWPRSFDLETDLTYADGSMAAFYSMRPIKIRQQVEVISATMLGYSCTGLADASPFIGLEFTWYGGGFAESDTNTAVEFWLSKDGAIPATDTNDSTHRRLLQSVSSPNKQITTRVPIGTILGGGAGLGSGTGDVASVADPGDYELLSVFSPFNSDRFISEPFGQSVTLCGYRAGAAVKTGP
ncbi:MAG: hypothetical protein HY287_04690 [Planctomycetes bacterium]|nr:hypothetical protein [Planctomycetota bacterium]